MEVVIQQSGDCIFSLPLLRLCDKGIKGTYVLQILNNNTKRVIFIFVYKFPDLYNCLSTTKSSEIYLKNVSVVVPQFTHTRIINITNIAN